MTDPKLALRAARTARPVPKVAVKVPAPAAPADTGMARSGLNRATALALIAVVLFTPVAAGGNRAPVWLIAAAVVFALTAVQALVLFIQGRGARPLRLANLRGVLACAAAFLAYGLVQLLPIGLAHLPDLDAPPTISLAPQATVLALLRVAASVVFLVLMVEVAGPLARARAIGWVIYAGVVVHAVWGLVALNLLGDSFFWGEKLAYRGAVTGTFINRNAFATFLGLGAVLGLALMIERMHAPRMRRPGGTGGLFAPETILTALVGVTLALVLMALAGTQSRMGLAATAAGLGVVVAGSRWPADARLGRWKLLLGLVAVLALALGVAGGVLDRALFTLEDADARLELWRQVLTMIAARPLTGFGLDAFAPAFELFHQPSLTPALIWDYAHSTYLTLWVEMGLLAGSLPLLAGALVLVRLIRLRRARSHDVALPVAALGALVLGAVHSLVDFSLEIQGNLFLLLAILGLGLARRMPQGRGAPDA